MKVNKGRAGTGDSWQCKNENPVSLSFTITVLPLAMRRFVAGQAGNLARDSFHLCSMAPYFASCPVLDVTLFPSFSSYNIIFFLFFSFPSIVYYQSSTFLERSCSPSSYFAASPNSMASNYSTTPVTLSIRQSKGILLSPFLGFIF